LKAVQTEWRTIAERDYGGVAPELLSAWYTNVMAPMGSNALAPAFLDYLFEYYMVPALLREYPDLRSSPARRKAKMLMIPLFTLQQALRSNPLASNDSIPSLETPNLAYAPARRLEQWKQLSAIFYDLPALIERYLLDSSLVGESDQSNLISLNLTLAYLKPCWQIQDHLVNHRLIEAVDELKKIAVKGKESVPPSEFHSLAYTVFHELARKKMSVEALEVADMLAAHQIRQYPPDPRGIAPLKPLYLDADSVHGEERYNLAIRRYSSAQPVSPPSKTVTLPLLSGRFLDLISGDTLNLSAFRGKIVVMKFWTTWCGSCVSQIPFLKNYAQSLKSNQNTAFISVLCDLTTWDRGEAFLSQFVAAQGINYVVLVDPKEDPLSRRFSVQWYPSTFVIGRDGQIALKPKDAGDWSKVQQYVATIQSR
jgi:thiol-disulfide isomerase/thioredoxin